jgi:hypothetical protein
MPTVTGISPDFTLKKGDLLPELPATLCDENNVPVNLTGGVVKFLMGRVPGTPDVNAVCTVVDTVNGKVKYTWLPGDTDIAGIYYAEFEVFFSGVKRFTFPNRGFLVVLISKTID